jgi:hypothetical protein
MGTTPADMLTMQLALQRSPASLSEKQVSSQPLQSVLLLAPKHCSESDGQSGSSRRSRRLIGVLPGTAAQRLAVEAIAVRVMSQCIVGGVLWLCRRCCLLVKLLVAGDERTTLEVFVFIYQPKPTGQFVRRWHNTKCRQ